MLFSCCKNLLTFQLFTHLGLTTLMSDFVDGKKKMTQRRVVKLAVLSLVSGLSLLASTASGASAAFVILYYNSNGNGSCYVQSTNISSYSTQKFTQASYCVDQAGKNQNVKNNTASIAGDSDVTFCVYENSGYKGRVQRIPPSDFDITNLNSALKNNNAGGRFC